MLTRINRNFVPTYWDDFFNDKFFNVQDTTVKGKNSPAVNVLENEKGFSIELAAPGVAQEDFNIEVENDLLTISAEQREASKDSDIKYLRKEFGFNAFKRSFQLPDTINVASISARHNNGILSIELPKKAEVVENAHRQIKVEPERSGAREGKAEQSQKSTVESKSTKANPVKTRERK